MKGGISFSLFCVCVLKSDGFLHHSTSVARGLCAKKTSEDCRYDEYPDSVSKYSNRCVKKKDLKPRHGVQRNYHADINDDDIKIVIASGPAGTGKTLFPAQHAAKLLLETDKKIILTRPLISADEDLGYLPGDINQKMDPWIIPIFDVFRDFYSQSEINAFIADNRIEIVPLAFMRGRTFKNTFIIGDELQNSSNRQLLMLLTRLDANSKMVVTGDVDQCDHTENGLLYFLNNINLKYPEKSLLREKGISVIEFTNRDIQRSPVIKTILNIYAFKQNPHLNSSEPGGDKLNQ